MSQNLDATAINQIHALISAQGVNEIISKIGADAVAVSYTHLTLPTSDLV